MYVDFCRWLIVNIPGLKSIDIRSLVGDTLRIVAYSYNKNIKSMSLAGRNGSWCACGKSAHNGLFWTSPTLKQLSDVCRHSTPEVTSRHGANLNLPPAQPR